MYLKHVTNPQVFFLNKPEEMTMTTSAAQNTAIQGRM